jgi:LPLT family lysophospholipid transporter-like MFS transporter
LLAGQLHQVGDLRRTKAYGFALAAMLTLLYTVEPLGFWRAPVIHLGALHLIVPVVLLLVATGIVAGLFLIPLNAALQAESDQTKLGKTIAVQNLGDNLGMLLAGAYVFAGVKAGLSASGVFLGLAVGVAAIAACMKFSPKSVTS